MPIFRLCRLLQVSVSGFFGAIAAQASDSSMTWFYSPMSGQPFGAAARATVQSGSMSLPRMGSRLDDRVARLMRGNGLSPKRKQKFKKTTDSQHNKAVASNLLDQFFCRCLHISYIRHRA